MKRVKQIDIGTVGDGRTAGHDALIRRGTMSEIVKLSRLLTLMYNNNIQGDSLNTFTSLFFQQCSYSKSDF
jgi:hypothetical protein